VLILRDVLGYRASEVASMLDSTEESVTSALKRARTAIKDSTPSRSATKPADSPAETRLAERLTSAYQAGDVATIIALFTEDAWLRMPPVPLEYQGLELIGEFLRVVAFREGRTYTLVPARVNRQLAFESFLPGATEPNDLLVLTLTAEAGLIAGASGGSGVRIAAMTRFAPGTARVAAMPGLGAVFAPGARPASSVSQ
jgi:RNA polymerase sigma-70 factor (ECF subfamily)